MWKLYKLKGMWNFVRRNRKVKKQNRFEELLEIPKEISSNEPRITIAGFNEMLIENYKGILEYQEFFIRINTYTGIININGFNLSLTEMTLDDVVVRGKIDSIDFEALEDVNS